MDEEFTLDREDLQAVIPVKGLDNDGFISAKNERQKLLIQLIKKYDIHDGRVNFSNFIQQKYRLLKVIEQKEKDLLQTIFSERDLITYFEPVETSGSVVDENMIILGDIDQFLRLMYFPRNSPTFKEAKEIGPEAEFIKTVLKADRQFRGLLDATITKHIMNRTHVNPYYLRNDEDQTWKKDLKTKNKLWWGCFESILRYLRHGYFLQELTEDILNNINLTHHEEEFNDWKRILEAKAQIHEEQNLLEKLDSKNNIPVLFNFLYTLTESQYFPANMIDDKLILSCTFGPKGYHKKVALLNEIDPHIGILKLIPTNRESFDSNIITKKDTLHEIPQAIGAAYLFECRNEHNPIVWLVEGIDAGISIDMIEKGDWRKIFYQGIINAAKKAKNTPEKIYFNQHTTNHANKKFNNFIQTKGERKEVFLEKIGRVDALIEVGIKKPEHYMETFHYQRGTVWTKDCKGIADVVEIDLEGAL